MKLQNIPPVPREQLDAWAPAVEFIRDLCVKLKLDFIEQHASQHGARRFYVYFGKTCLVSADDPMQVEHYLYGFRDGRSVPMPEAHDAADALLEAERHAKDIKEAAENLARWIDRLDEFIDPLTRERA